MKKILSNWNVTKAFVWQLYFDELFAFRFAQLRLFRLLRKSDIIVMDRVEFYVSRPTLYIKLTFFANSIFNRTYNFNLVLLNDFNAPFYFSITFFGENHIEFSFKSNLRVIQETTHLLTRTNSKAHKIIKNDIFIQKGFFVL